MITPLDPEEPVRSDAIAEAGGGLERQFGLVLVLDLAGQFLDLLLALEFHFRGEVANPDQPVVEEVLLQDHLALELELAEPLAGDLVNPLPHRFEV